MSSPQAADDSDSGPKSTSAFGWHERRIGKLEEAFLGISTSLLPSVARLEEKIDGMHRALGEVRQDLGRFNLELDCVKDRMNDETTGNVVRDIQMKEVQTSVLTRKERHRRFLYEALKVGGAIIASVTGTFLVIWLKLK